MVFKSIIARCSFRFISVATSVKLEYTFCRKGENKGRLSEKSEGSYCRNPINTRRYRRTAMSKYWRWYLRPKIAVFSGNRLQLWKTNEARFGITYTMWACLAVLRTLPKV